LKKADKKYPFLRFYNFSQGDISADKKISPFPSFPQIGSRRKEGREPIYSSLSAELEVKDSADDGVIFYIPAGKHKVSED
jgi:hypothetical protein